MAETLSSLLISPMGFLVSLYLIAEVCAMTLNPAIFERAEMSSSVMPSENISLLGVRMICLFRQFFEVEQLPSHHDHVA